MIRGRARAIEHSATWGEGVSKVPKRHAAEFQRHFPACELPPRTRKYLLLMPPTMLTRPTKAWQVCG